MTERYPREAYDNATESEKKRLLDIAISEATGIDREHDRLPLSLDAANKALTKAEQAVIDGERNVRETQKAMIAFREDNGFPDKDAEMRQVIGYLENGDTKGAVKLINSHFLTGTILESAEFQTSIKQIIILNFLRPGIGIYDRSIVPVLKMASSETLDSPEMKQAVAQYLDEMSYIDNPQLIEMAKSQFNLSDDEVYTDKRKQTLLKLLEKYAGAGIDLRWREDTTIERTYSRYEPFGIPRDKFMELVKIKREVAASAE